MIDQDGYVHVLSRADDVMNVAGHRLSTSLLEQGDKNAQHLHIIKLDHIFSLQSLPATNLSPNVVSLANRTS